MKETFFENLSVPPMGESMNSEPTIPSDNTLPEHEVLIVTGLSGAGKTSMMRALEDLGFYCVDNLPVPLITSFLQLAVHTNNKRLRVALGIDARNEQFLGELTNELLHIKKEALVANPTIIFLNARSQTLHKRFQDTRRTHPLASDSSLEQAINKEKMLMDPIMQMADMILDTDNLNIHELRAWVRKTFADANQHELMVNLISFGFKYGVPIDSNLVYDLRFLPNPHFVPTLKTLDGRHEAIQSFLFTQPAVLDYWPRLVDFLRYSLDKCYEEGLFFISVAIGCTGGKHRSVAFVEKLSKEVWPQTRFLVTHRDIGKE